MPIIHLVVKGNTVETIEWFLKSLKKKETKSSGIFPRLTLLISFVIWVNGLYMYS